MSFRRQNQTTFPSNDKYTIFLILQVGHEIEPNVIFSAHQHASRIITYPPIHIKQFNHDSSPISYDFTETGEKKRLEIMVPTSSYRMGSKEIGYGYSIVGKWKK